LQQTTDKIVYRYRAYALHITALTDPDDEKYFQLAVNSPNKVVISEDSDIANLAQDPQITHLGINIWGFDFCLTKI
jgi:hypothetical protein